MPETLKVWLFPLARLSVVAESFRVGSVTVTLHSTFFPPAVTVILAVEPPETVLEAVTVILLSLSVAVILELLEEICAVLPVLLVRVKVPEPPIAMLRVLLSKDNAPLSVIVIVQDADLSSCPFILAETVTVLLTFALVVGLMVTLFPLSVIVTIPEGEASQIISASSGVVVAVNVTPVLLRGTGKEDLERVTL